MARTLPENDFRRVRNCLIGDAYRTPGRQLDRNVWDNLVNLNDTVLIETTDTYPNIVESAHSIGWSWLDIFDTCPKDSPISSQIFAALECFEGSRFNAYCGWYRIAGIVLRCGLEDVLLGLYFQLHPDRQPTFSKIIAGEELSPKLGVILRELAGVSAAAADLCNEAKDLYHKELSVYVHRVSHGTIWESTGPVFVPDALETWFDQYLRTYRLLCHFVDVVVPGARASEIAGRVCAEVSEPLA
jgi:hypothetical protein